MKELSKTYDPKQTEGRIYELWEKSGAFSPQLKPETLKLKPFSIVIPPPNVTGSLHMGHALNNTIQDILIRRSRMKGVPTLWVPGTDHAGIATQNVVEKQLAKEGKTRHDLGREEFEKRVWQHVEKYGHIIIDQLKKLGCSCDWTRERFTLDKDYSEAVKKAFIYYYEKGFIYQGERVINWCIRCQTALSDIELEHKLLDSKLWYISYPISSGEASSKEESITVATTRPETMLGDTAIGVHPDDMRYVNYLGKKATIPLVNREIPIVIDEAIDPKFGTGAVKITPAHDIKDFEIAERRQLEAIKIIDEAGRITEQGGKFAGLDTAQARAKIIEELEREGWLVKVEDYQHEVPHCYRCGRKVEQILSLQWFLKMADLALPAISVVQNDDITFVPIRWKKVYLDWLENVRDWCISRQIWWGHRLPVYIKQEEILNPKSEILNKSQIQNSKSLEIRNSDLEIYIGDEPPFGFRQVNDVLDTWFSSALWPFAVLGWPEKNLKSQNSKLKTDLEYFYPTTILSTARDLIFLWVPRMIFSGIEFMAQKPFETVYIHPTIFNVEGKRMSKSLGTGIDPLELIEKYGADATRFGLTFINTGVQDIKFDENAILAGQKFANKLWNISRYILMQTDGAGGPVVIEEKPEPKSEIDKKILERLDILASSINTQLDNFQFGQAAHELYEFIWHDLADEYLEKTKTQLQNLEYRVRTIEILLYILTQSLKLLHPFMPFITEEIWQILHQKKLVPDSQEKYLILAKWPEK